MCTKWFSFFYKESTLGITEINVLNRFFLLSPYRGMLFFFKCIYFLLKGNCFTEFCCFLGMLFNLSTLNGIHKFSGTSRQTISPSRQAI